MVNLIEDILDYSRMKFGHFELVNSWFTIDEVIDEVYGMVDF
jgi:signal transduction histidine kinase